MLSKEEAIECLNFQNEKFFGGQSEALKMAISALSEELSEDGTLTVHVSDGSKVKRVFVMGDNIFGGLYYPDSAKNKGGWIPIETRPMTKEEKEHYADFGYSEDSIEFMYDCPLPEDGQEVLVSTKWGVNTDTFYRDEGCYFETYCDEDEVLAWQPLPEPYKKGE